MHGKVQRLVHTSMRPRSFERGNKVGLVLFSSLRRITSMRPRSFERGNIPVSYVHVRIVRTSMRPRSFERGNGLVGYPTARSGVHFNEAALFRTRKPMGPQRRTRWPSSTSMRPRSFERGNEMNFVHVICLQASLQ